MGWGVAAEEGGGALPLWRVEGRIKGLLCMAMGLVDPHVICHYVIVKGLSVTGGISHAG